MKYGCSTSAKGSACWSVAADPLHCDPATGFVKNAVEAEQTGQLTDLSRVLGRNQGHATSALSSPRFGEAEVLSGARSRGGCVLLLPASAP